MIRVFASMLIKGIGLSFSLFATSLLYFGFRVMLSCMQFILAM
jgi:hypothetical protein